MQPTLQKGWLIVLCFLFFITAAAQENLPDDYLPASFHQGRREAARALMPEGSVMVVFAAPVRNFSNDVDYLYHQNPDLYYFTGYKEPNAVLFLFREPQKDAAGNTFNELFFVQPRNAMAEQWTGRRLGAEGAQSKLGIKNSFPASAFKDHPISFSSFARIIMASFPEGVADERQDQSDLFDLIEQFKIKAAANPVANNNRIDARLFRQITGSLREIKTPEELALIRKAVEISCLGQNEVMKAVQPSMSELEIQGLHEFVHKKYGAEGVGYGSIVGSGENGCILHYMENSKTAIGTEMLLMDVGAEYHGYTADVTRTVPVDGKFSEEEKAIYQLVYDAQEAAFKVLKDGAKWNDASTAAREVIANGLLKLGIIKNKSEVGKYYPHGLGHHIGLDVHDRAASNTLKKGMVMTIEPGIYIPKDSPCDKKWWSIAVRIEDDVLIRENDYELLSAFAPRSIEAIEKMIAEKSLLDNYKLPPLKSAEKKSF
jgi:Xaa-Pro aminopeptidase